MPIRKHLTDKTSFGPAAIEAMSKAFEEACIALQVYAGDEKGREIIATRIIVWREPVWLMQQHCVTASWQRRVKIFEDAIVRTCMTILRQPGLIFSGQHRRRS